MSCGEQRRTIDRRRREKQERKKGLSISLDYVVQSVSIVFRRRHSNIIKRRIIKLTQHAWQKCN